MVAATIYPEPAKVGRGQKVCATQTFPGVDPARLSNARTVIAFAPDLVEDVKNGASLADAYETALAYQLTEDARDDLDKATKSLAQQLAARGCTQQAIAEQLGVGQKTVSNWLSNLREAPELLGAPALPSSDTLDQIAQAIKDQAKAEVRQEAADEIKAEVEAIRKDFAPSERVAILQTIERKPVGKPSEANRQNLVDKTKAAKLAGFGNRETARQATRVVHAQAVTLVSIRFGQPFLPVGCPTQNCNDYASVDFINTLRCLR